MSRKNKVEESGSKICRFRIFKWIKVITSTGKILTQPGFKGHRRSANICKICLHGLKESLHEHDTLVGVKVIW